MKNSNATAAGLPGVILESWYEGGESAGVIAIIVAAGISLVAVLGLLIMLGFESVRPRSNPTSQSLFLQSSIGTYFISLLVADVIQALGSIMNIRWVQQGKVVLGDYCTSQGSIKNVGNIASAIWTLVIASHVFNHLFLRMEHRKYIAIAVAISAWSFIGAVAIFGPAVLEKKEHGPFFGVSGYWCWITQEYPGAQVGVEYFWMFFSATTSFVLYTLVFLRLRGNLTIQDGWKPQLTFVSREKAWQLQASRDAVDAHMTGVARQMLWYPLGYTFVIIPIAIARFLDTSGANVHFGWTVFADMLFMLSGFINVVVFLITRSHFPAVTVLPTYNIPRKPPPSVFIPPGSEGYIDPYYLSTPKPRFASGEPPSTGDTEKSFGTADRHSHFPHHHLNLHRAQDSFDRSKDQNYDSEYTPDARMLDHETITTSIRAMPVAVTRNRSIGSDPHDLQTRGLESAAASINERSFGSTTRELSAAGNPFEDFTSIPASRVPQTRRRDSREDDEHERGGHDLDAPLKNPFEEDDGHSPNSIYSPERYRAENDGNDWRSPLSAYLEDVSLSPGGKRDSYGYQGQQQPQVDRLRNGALASRSRGSVASNSSARSYGGRV